MKFDKNTGLWKDSKLISNSFSNTNFEEEPGGEENESELVFTEQNNTEPTLKGSCILSIRFENHAQYQKWLRYNPGRQWDFLVNYPAVVRAKYEFRTSMDVEVMVKKIVQLLHMGFDVASAAWVLEEDISKGD